MSLFTLTYISTTHQQMDEYTDDKWEIYIEPFLLHRYLLNSILQIDSMHFIENEQTFIVTSHIFCMIENPHK